MRFKFSLAAAAATAAIAAATATSAATVYYNEQPLMGQTPQDDLTSYYIGPLGNPNGFAVKPGKTYDIDFTVPVFETLFSVQPFLHTGTANYYLSKYFNFSVYKDACGGGNPASSANTCLGSLVAPTGQSYAAGGTRADYSLPELTSAANYVLVVNTTSQAKAGLLQGDIVLQGVPEPTTWALMLLGVGLIGLMARRRATPALALA